MCKIGPFAKNVIKITKNREKYGGWKKGVDSYYTWILLHTYCHTHSAAQAILKCAHLLHIYLDNIFVCPLLAPSHTNSIITISSREDLVVQKMMIHLIAPNCLQTF